MAESRITDYWVLLTALAGALGLSIAAVIGWHWYVQEIQPYRKAEARLLSKLPFPESAQLKSVRRHRGDLCGLVDYERRRGERTGYVAFVASLHGTVMIDEPMFFPVAAIACGDLTQDQAEAQYRASVEARRLACEAAGRSIGLPQGTALSAYVGACVARS